MKTREWFISVLRDLAGTQKALREQQLAEEACGREMKALDKRVDSMIADVRGTLMHEFDVEKMADELVRIQQVAATRDRWAAKLSNAVVEEDRLDKLVTSMVNDLLTFPIGEVAEKDAEYLKPTPHPTSRMAGRVG